MFILFCVLTLQSNCLNTHRTVWTRVLNHWWHTNFSLFHQTLYVLCYHSTLYALFVLKCSLFNPLKHNQTKSNVTSSTKKLSFHSRLAPIETGSWWWKMVKLTMCTGSGSAISSPRISGSIPTWALQTPTPHALATPRKGTTLSMDYVRQEQGPILQR